MEQETLLESESGKGTRTKAIPRKLETTEKKCYY